MLARNLVYRSDQFPLFISDQGSVILFHVADCAYCACCVTSGFKWLIVMEDGWAWYLKHANVTKY